MGYKARRVCCSILFHIKALLAFSFTSSLLLGLSYLTYYKHLHPDLPTPGAEINTPIGAVPQGAPPGTPPVDPGTCVKGALGLLEPPAGLMMGYSLSWTGTGQPADLKGRLGGKTPAVYNAFYRLLNDPAAPLDPPLSVLTWQAEEVKRAGGILGLTLEPTGDVTLITDDLINTIVGKLKELNDGGVPVILRYGHEMNGDWTSYGLRPLQFVPMFRRMAEAVHKGTKTTAMMWAPNVGVHYPYTPLGKPGGTSPVTSVGADNFAALDTNADDVLDEKDDPYLPYWPGPEYVDWVGLSLYYYQDNPVNNVPGPTYFEDYLLGKDLVSKHGATVGNNEALRNFYTRFGDTFLKPVAIAESGPGYRPGAPGASELDVKQAWWTQTLNPATLASLPRLKLLVNFEEAKVEDGVAKDWSLTGNVGVREAYDAFLGTSGAQLVWGDRVRLACDGSLEVLP